MFDKENADNIEKINAGLGTRHRSTPYDLTNPDDLSQAFLLTVAACMDYRRYWRSLERICEEFDESVENYDTASWINMGYKPEKADELAMDAAGAVGEAADIFWEIIERSDRNCAMIIKAILSAPTEVQKKVWGKAYSIPVNERDTKIKKLFEGLLESDVHYAIPDNRDEFLRLMDAVWGSAEESE